VPVGRTLLAGLCCCGGGVRGRQVSLGSSAWWCVLAGPRCELPQGKSRHIRFSPTRMVASSKGLDLQLVAGMAWITSVNLAVCLIQSCLCASGPKPAGSSLPPPCRYSAIRKKLDELDQITHQTLLDLYDYNMSLARSDWSTLSTRKRSSRSLLHHVQRHPLRRQKRDNLVNLPENSPSVDKNDWKIGFVLVRSLDTPCLTHSGLCVAIVRSLAVPFPT